MKPFHTVTVTHETDGTVSLVNVIVSVVCSRMLVRTDGRVQRESVRA